MDTQWPLYEVFEQESPGQPHRNAGSVHAPDAEMALQNARDVFVRRPDCASLWVVPAGQVLSCTVEQLAGQPAALALASGEPVETYEVFHKHTHRQSETYVTHLGRVEAASPLQALGLAQARFLEQAALVWWVVPARAITASQPADVESWFAPARDRPYRQPGFYHVLTQMRAIKASGQPGDPGEAA